MAAGDPGSPARYYSSTAVETSLQSSIAAQSQGASNTSFIVASISGFPTSFPYTLIVDPDTSKEEVVTVTAGSSTTLTVTRGVDNTQAVAHSAGAVVRHGVSGRDFRESQNHIAARGYDTDSAILAAANQTHVHGLASGDGDVVGTTKTQTLTNKTLTSPTITGTPGVGTSIVFEGSTTDDYETTLTVVDPTADRTITLPNATGTVILDSATQTLTNKTLTSPTISGSPVITGLSSAGMVASSATPKDYVDAILGSATAAATSAASAAASATAAATSASSASTSASSALTSANSASASATAAATSATSAAASATAAATSATSAAASATSASTSETNAATSASSASTSASSALTSANSASTSASSALTSANSASTSATAAATSATSAAASATAAATSASSASTSASSALTSANSAATSAASAAAAVAASFDAKGDLLVGTGAQAFDQLTVAATNGYILSVNSATTTGLEWVAANPGDITAVNAGNGLQGGGTSGSVTLGLDTNAKGDLIVGTGNDTSTILTVGSTNGYLLAVNSATTSGLEWQAAPAGYLAPTIGSTLITSGTTVSTITAVTLSNATLSGTLTASASSGTNGQYLKSTGTGVEWGTVQAGSQVKINGGAASTYDYIDFVGMGTDTATTGTVKVSPIVVTDADPGKKIFVGTTTPTSPTTGDVWIDESVDGDPDLRTMTLMGAY